MSQFCPIRACVFFHTYTIIQIKIISHETKVSFINNMVIMLIITLCNYHFFRALYEIYTDLLQKKITSKMFLKCNFGGKDKSNNHLLIQLIMNIFL
ncbi:hypothetical protein HmCmsJML070_00451 [Escherichia coli]|nr:hypothetical protein HmCmsJML070_00451 [Escherichia coli]